MAAFSPMGFVKVASAGTPVPLISGTNAPNIVVPNVLITALLLRPQVYTNGRIYLLSTKSAADKTNFLNVVWFFASANDTLILNTPLVNGIDPTQLWVDADNSNDGLLVTPQVY